MAGNNTSGENWRAAAEAVVQHLDSQDYSMDNLLLPSQDLDRQRPALPSQSSDSVLAQLLDGAQRNTAPMNGQQIFHAVSPSTASTQPQPVPMPSGGPPRSQAPARNTRGRRQTRLAAARRPFYAGGLGGRAAENERHRVHVEAERTRRVAMREQYAALRTLLPLSATMSRMDRASVVMAAVTYIANLEDEIERLQSFAPRGAFPFTGGLECVDYSSDPNALTAVITWPTPGSAPSTMASFLGTNVAVHPCGQYCDFAISFPHRDHHVRLLEQILALIVGHHLEVLSASVVVRNRAVLYSINCQAHANADLLSPDLHAALQAAVNNFIRTN